MLGKPVSMRMAPNTPKPGSIFVSRVIAVGDGDSVDVADGEGVIVRVTLNEVGRTVVTVTSWPPDLVTTVVVKLIEPVAVVRDASGEDVDDSEVD